MNLDSFEICPNCKKRYVNNSGKCEFCGSTFSSEVDGNTPQQNLDNRILVGIPVALVAFALVTYALTYWYQGFCVKRTAAEMQDMPSNIPALLLPPVQTELSPSQVFMINRCKLTKFASYAITARVLNVTDNNYNLHDEAADLSPVDLTLGWDFMADKRVSHQLWIIEGGRFAWMFPPKELYRYTPDKQLIRFSQTYSHWSNNHIIPANDRVNSLVKSLHRDQIVTLTGALVTVVIPNDIHWNSSMSRDDVGDGACEIMYVEDVHIH